MPASSTALRKKIENLLQEWRREGIPPRWTLQNLARDLLLWRTSQGIEGLWDPPPLMVTATLDDGWGHGIELIESWGRAAGLRILSLGLMRSADCIIEECRTHAPDLVGLSVLQLDSESELRRIGSRLPGHTKLIAGGPVFQIDPEIARRTGVHHVARSAADFLEMLLALEAAS